MAAIAGTAAAATHAMSAGNFAFGVGAGTSSGVGDILNKTVGTADSNGGMDMSMMGITAPPSDNNQNGPLSNAMLNHFGKNNDNNNNGEK